MTASQAPYAEADASSPPGAEQFRDLFLHMQNGAVIFEAVNDGNDLKKQGALQNIEFQMLKKDGSALLVSLDGEVFTNYKGELIQTLCVFRDITK